MNIKRGQIWYANLSPVVGSEQGGMRPVLVVSNNIGNSRSTVITVAPLTSQTQKKRLPTQVLIGTESGLSCLSMVMCEQVRTIDKQRLMDNAPLGTVPQDIMCKVDYALKVALNI